MKHTITLVLLIFVSAAYAQDAQPTSTATNRWVSEVMTKSTATNPVLMLTGATSNSFKDLFNANDN